MDEDSRLSSRPRDAALEDLAHRYARLIRAIVSRVGGRAAANATDDVGQEVLLALWRRLDGEQPIEHPTSYVYKAAVRETLRLLRRARARAEDPLEEGAAAEIADGPLRAEGDADRQLRARETRAAIDGCLAGLTSERAAAVRAHLAGFEAQEIMAFHGWPYQKARNLIARGMGDLRRCLSAKGIHD
jgi:RNA polymerase sigma factor (sigma-70 family)